MVKPYILSQSTESPQGCVLSPLLFFLLTHDCEEKSSTTQMMKFIDDRIMVGLIDGNNETADRGKVEVVRW